MAAARTASRWGRHAHWSQILAKQRDEIADLKRQMQVRADAIAIQIGDMKAHVIRLDALGQRLTSMAGIKSTEFNFGQDPPRADRTRKFPAPGRRSPTSRPCCRACRARSI